MTRFHRAGDGVWPAMARIDGMLVARWLGDIANNQGAMKIRSPFGSLRIPPELVGEFFAVFSRFEFTLKESGYVIPHRRRAETDWHRFAREAGNSLAVTSGSEVEAAIAFLTELPPQVQTRLGGWQAEGLHGETSTARALDAVCRVRHNLFHGGKHTPHSPPGRDERLVRCALTVLIACLEQNDDLRTTFEQAGF